MKTRHLMKWTTQLCSLLLAGCIAVTAQPGSSVSASPSENKTHQQWLDTFHQLPMSFETNVGQTDPHVAFVSRGAGYCLFLTHDEAVFSLVAPVKSSHATLRMHFNGTNPESAIAGQDLQHGKSNYFIGNDLSKWRTGIQNFAGVVTHDLYRGVDLVYYGNQKQLEYDLRVAPGANPAQISIDFRSDLSLPNRTMPLRVDADGNLVSATNANEVLLRKPVAYQLIRANSGTPRKRLVDAQYLISTGNRVRFQLGPYDRSQTLIIDPIIPFFSSYLGGLSDDYGYGVAMDPSGNAYVTGATISLNFPVIACLQCVNRGASDAFVTEINAAGLVYSTYLGGARDDHGYGIAVDAKGSAFITGDTFSANFPTKACFQCSLSVPPDAFVTRLAPGGAAFDYSTYLGGKATDIGRAIAIDWLDNAYVTGNTNSNNFPVPACTFGCARAGANDAFVTEIGWAPAAGPAAIVYSDYLGGKANDFGYGIAVDMASTAFVTGSTLSANFPVIAGCFQCALGAAGTSDAFVTHVAANGTGLINSTYLGGVTNDIGYAIALDPNSEPFVTGSTAGAFPVGAWPCFQCAFGGGVTDAFVTKLNAPLSNLIYSSYLGGKKADVGRGIAVDINQNADLTGNTNSLNFPLFNCFQCAFNGGAMDAFVTSLNPTGTGLVYSTYLGGKGQDYGRGIAVNATFSPTAAWVAGYTNSTNFPIWGGVVQPFAGGFDAFVTGMP